MSRLFSWWCALAVIALMGGAVVAQDGYVDGELFRDPTLPAYMAGAGTGAGDATSPGVGLRQGLDRSQYVLSFIRTGGGNPMAVINDQSLSIGDRLGDALVRDIRPTEVILVIGGQELVVSTISLPVRESVN